jgi:hypothetical protein
MFLKPLESVFSLHFKTFTIQYELSTIISVAFAGIGQGEWAGPGIYIGSGELIQKSKSRDDLNFVGYSFVDDTDPIQSFKDGKIMEVLAHCTQSAIGNRQWVWIWIWICEKEVSEQWTGH